MENRSFEPTSLCARLISVHPDKQDIRFPLEPDEDQTSAEWAVSQNLNGEIFIKNISASYLRVEKILLEINQEKRLFGGERINLNQDQDRPDYVFFRIDFNSALKRERETMTILNAEKMTKLIKIENDLPKELTCSICTDFLHKCMTLAPCQHSFCSFCLFDHLKLSSQCPLCRTEATSVAKNSVLSKVIQLVEDNFSIQERFQERKKLEEITFGGVIVRNSQGVYFGSYVNGKKDGQGKMIFKDGGISEGNWKNDKREGKGVVVYYNGDIYDGFWMNDKKHGAGKYIWSSGKEYEGNFQDGLINGFGTIKYEDGRIYQGEWKNESPEGRGILTLPNGDKYEGEWLNSVLQPKVKIEYSNGEKYEGEINVGNLQKQGKGALIVKNGDKYQGIWVEDVLQPEVKIEYSNGGKYEGEIEANSLKKQGKGILILHNGDKCKGTWIENVLQPEITIEYSNGDKYEGQINIESLQKQGKGVLITNDGDRYDGDWANDKQHGYGKCTWKGNKFVYEGIWEEGKFTRDGVMTYMEGTGLQAKWKKLEEVESFQEDSLKGNKEKNSPENKESDHHL